MHKKISLLSIEHPLESVALRTLFGVLLILILAYIYFVGASILNVMERKEAVARSAEMETSIAKLENNYFALSQRITPETGSMLGLAPIRDVAYVHRPGTVGQADNEQKGI